MRPICIDANVFIASTKGNEHYSSGCKRVIQAVADGEFYLIEPAICLTEVIRNITRYLGIEGGKNKRIISGRWFLYGNYVALYGTYAMDSIYLETALKHHAVLVSLDEEDFLLRIKERVGIEIYHPRDFR
jgi:predicted nucleic acid-binding protein